MELKDKQIHTFSKKNNDLIGDIKDLRSHYNQSHRPDEVAMI